MKMCDEKNKINTKSSVDGSSFTSGLVFKTAVEVIFLKHQFTKVVKVLTEIFSFTIFNICQFLENIT
jgi:hypothetical protein